LGSLATSLVVLVMTNKMQLAISVGILDSVVKVFAYFVHERVWAKIPFGRLDQPFAGTIGTLRTEQEATEPTGREAVRPEVAQFSPTINR
jgi:uncharacterized membrane protein